MKPTQQLRLAKITDRASGMPLAMDVFDLGHCKLNDGVVLVVWNFSK
jgi:hypothetical protein